MKNIHLALKFFYRELIHGELTLLFAAVVIAIGSLSSIGFLTKRVEQSIQSHTARLSGGALVLKSSAPVPSAWLQQADELQLEVASMISFPSMLSLGDEFSLARVKAVTDNFPLQGSIYIKKRIAAGIFAEQTEQVSAPPAGHIWIAPRLWHSLTDRLSEQLTDHSSASGALLLDLGEAQLQLSALLDNMPGQSSGTLFSIAPTAVINMADIEKTATLQAGSRVEYLYFFSPGQNPRHGGRATDSVKRYQHWIEQRLLPGQSIRTGAEGIPAVNRNIKKAGQFVSLAALLSVLLAAIAIVISSHQYAVRQNKQVAILLSLGCSERNLIKISILKLLLLGLIASLSGILIGFIVQAVLFYTLQDFIPEPLPQLSLIPVWSGLLSGFLLLLSVSMANLLHIRQVSPVQMMRNEEIVAPVSRLLLYGFSITGLMLISLWSTQNLTITLWFYVIIIVSALLCYLCAQGVLRMFLWLSQRYALINRLSWINIQRHQQQVLLQITTFSLIFALVILLYLLRTELLETWQQQLPEGTPNHFVINLQNHETSRFIQFLSQQGIDSQGIFPMVRGRLIQINGTAVKQAVPEQARDHNALNRELNLSFAMQQEAGQQLLAGQWWDQQSLQNSWLAQISIESSLAHALDIKPGDILGFQIGSKQIDGMVANIRQVKWDSFKPNFYLIFSPGVIEQFPLTYISSFYLPTQLNHSLNEMIMQFPGISIIAVDQLILEIQYIIEKISLAIELVFGFIIIAGLLILASSLNSTLEIRLYENAILRILGASSKLIRRSLAIELMVVATISSVMGMIIAEASGFILYRQVFNLTYMIHPLLWGIVIVAAVLLITVAGLLLMNKVLNQTATQSLRKYG